MRAMLVTRPGCFRYGAVALRKLKRNSQRIPVNARRGPPEALGFAAEDRLGEASGGAVASRPFLKFQLAATQMPFADSQT